MSKQPETKNQKKLDARFYDSPEYREIRAQIMREIQNPVVIDRACWQKTEEEKIQLKNAKSIWKKTHKPTTKALPKAA
jgi:hypothetical protein